MTCADPDALRRTGRNAHQVACTNNRMIAVIMTCSPFDIRQDNWTPNKLPTLSIGSVSNPRFQRSFGGTGNDVIKPLRRVEAREQPGQPRPTMDYDDRTCIVHGILTLRVRRLRRRQRSSKKTRPSGNMLAE
nr:hypothetical protein CFP56_16589 [Quercus suber]